MTDDFDQDPEDISPEVEPEDEDEEFDPFSDPDYHAPNRCEDPKCLHPNCNDSDDGAGAERFPGENIWWKTNDKWRR